MRRTYASSVQWCLVYSVPQSWLQTRRSGQLCVPDGNLSSYRRSRFDGTGLRVDRDESKKGLTRLADCISFLLYFFFFSPAWMVFSRLTFRSSKNFLRLCRKILWISCNYSFYCRLFKCCSTMAPSNNDLIKRTAFLADDDPPSSRSHNLISNWD